MVSRGATYATAVFLCMLTLAVAIFFGIYMPSSAHAVDVEDLGAGNELSATLDSVDVDHFDTIALSNNAIVPSEATIDAETNATEDLAFSGTYYNSEGVATSLSPDTIVVNGNEISYVETYNATTAPATGAGLWLGSDSTTDGTWGYFIGHNPGPFHDVMGLTNGDAVTVCDTNGNTRTYHVIDTFVVPNTATWEDIESRVTGYGESIVVQTCCGDNATYRIVVCD